MMDRCWAHAGGGLRQAHGGRTREVAYGRHTAGDKKGAQGENRGQKQPVLMRQLHARAKNPA